MEAETFTIHVQEIGDILQVSSHTLLCHHWAAGAGHGWHQAGQGGPHHGGDCLGAGGVWGSSVLSSVRWGHVWNNIETDEALIVVVITENNDTELDTAQDLWEMKAACKVQSCWLWTDNDRG